MHSDGNVSSYKHFFFILWKETRHDEFNTDKMHTRYIASHLNLIILKHSSSAVVIIVNNHSETSEGWDFPQTWL